MVIALVACGGGARRSPPAPRPPSVYSDASIAAELEKLGVAVERIGTTAEQRPIVVAKLGTRGPAVLVVFGQHADEHDMPMLAMRLIRTAKLTDRRLYVVPLANPDGTARELASATPFTLRTNGRANLNRNWGAYWQPGDDAGTAGFSEPETRALRDFATAHPEIAGFIDVHSGSSGFNQGFILYPYAYADRDALDDAWRARYRELAPAFAQRMTCATDRRAGFEAVQPREVGDRVRAFLRQTVPAEHLDAALASVPASTTSAGASIDWAHDALRKPALGVEIARPFPSTTLAQFAADTARHLDACGDAYVRAIVDFAREL